MYKWLTKHKLKSNGGWRFGFIIGSQTLIIWLGKYGFTWYSKPYFN